ncbi:MAG: GxGYxYP family putative glycoside hydrolase [bacterium]
MKWDYLDHAAARGADGLRVVLLAFALAASACGGSGGGGGDAGTPRSEPLLPPPSPKDASAFTNAPELHLASGVAPEHIVRISQNALRQYEHLTIASLQGLVARGSTELIWIEPNEDQPWIDHVVATRGITWDREFDALDMLARFRDHIPGYVRIDSQGLPDSINAGISFAGLVGAIAVDRRQELHVAPLEIPMLNDLTGYDEAHLLAEHPGAFDRSIVFEQREDILPLLKDLPVLTGGFVYHDGEGRSPFGLSVLASQPPGGFLMGWRGQQSEQPMVEDASLNSLALIACDTCQNLSTLAQFSYQPPVRAPRPPVPALEPGVHYVSLLVTDGDNIGFLMNDVWKQKYFGNGLRGTYPLTWELSPALVRIAPPILEWYLGHGTPNDSFVAGPSGKGYILPHLEPNLNRFLDETEPMLWESGLHIATVIDELPIASGAYNPYLNRASIDAVIAKIGRYYSAGQGAVRWVGDKPIISVRTAIWEGFQTPEQAAAAISALPRAPGANTDAVSVVVIHPFSRFGASERDYALVEIGRRFRDSLASHVRLVPIEELIQHAKELR